jgi:hypothetical protein
MHKLKTGRRLNCLYTILGVLGIILWAAASYRGFWMMFGGLGEILLGILAIIIASIHGRNPIAWFAAVIWFPIPMILLVIVLGELKDVNCLYCGKIVDVDDSACPHCERPFHRGSKRIV